MIKVTTPKKTEVLSPVIQKFLNQMQANQLKKNSIQNYKRLLLALETRKPLIDYTSEDLAGYFNNDFKGTDSSYNLTVAMSKKFFKDIKKPDVTDWIKAKPVIETLKSDDILTPDDINAMIESTDNHYAKALIAFLFETGCRISEALALNFKDLQDTDSGIIVNIPTTKTAAGFRKVIIPFASQYLRNLKTYTGAKNSDKIFKLKYTRTSHIIEEAAKKAGIEKSVTPHKFRHAQATDLVKRGYNEAIIRKKLGWTPRSGMIERYQHLNDDDVINATLENTGKLPQTAAPRVEIKEANKITLVEASMQFSKLTEENSELKAKMDAQQSQLEATQKDMAEMKAAVAFFNSLSPEVKAQMTIERLGKKK